HRSGPDQAGRPIRGVRCGRDLESNEHRVAAVGTRSGAVSPGTVRPVGAVAVGADAVRAVAIRAGSVPRLPPLLERIRAGRERARPLPKPVEHDAAEAQRNGRTDRPEAPRFAALALRLRRTTRIVGGHRALRGLAACRHAPALPWPYQNPATSMPRQTS